MTQPTAEVISTADVFSLALATLALGVALWSFLRTHRTSIQPLRVFVRTTEGSWQLQNVGSGPALNLVVLEGQKPNTWSRAVHCTSIAVNSSITLHWLQQAAVLASTYTDAYYRHYTTHCVDYRNTISRRTLRHGMTPVPEWTVTGPETTDP